MFWIYSQSGLKEVELWKPNSPNMFLPVISASFTFMSVIQSQREKINSRNIYFPLFSVRT